MEESMKNKKALLQTSDNLKIEKECLKQREE